MSLAEFQLVAEGQGNPQASVLLPTYQAPYLAQALASILAQRDVILEILISDDASGDDTPQRILAQLRTYRGPHRVLFRQGRQRLRLDHFILLAEAASCEIAIMAHHDDIGLPQRASRLLALFAATGADVISSNCLIIDTTGRQRGLRLQGIATGFIPVEQMIQQLWLPPCLGATLAWRRRVYTDFPRLDTRYLTAGHDCLIPLRGALGNGFYYVDEPLLQRRDHATQWSKRMFDRKSRLTSQEADAARLLGIALAMHKDIQHYRDCGAAHAGEAAHRLDQLAALVTQSLIRQATALFDWRAQLMLAGQQVIWVDAATFASRQRPSPIRRLWRSESLRPLKNWLKSWRLHSSHQ